MINLKRYFRKGFSLTELLAAMLICTLIITSAIAVYSRAKKTMSSLNSKIDRDQLPMQILQRIAEDIDNITGPLPNAQKDVVISIKNKLDERYQSSQLIMTRKYYNERNQKEVFDEIVWQTNYDYDANGLVLYRSHKGLTVEDKVLDENKDDWKKELFVPVANGLTYFTIEAYKGTEFIDTWSEEPLPRAIRITLSFKPPYQDIDGNYELDDYDKEIRTVAVNRGRNYAFKFVEPDYDELFPEPNEPNEPNGLNMPDDLDGISDNEKDTESLSDLLKILNEQKNK